MKPTARLKLRLNTPKVRVKPSWRSLHKQNRNILQLTFAISAALLLFGSVGYAATFYVKTNGNDALSGASWALAKRSITNSMAAAAAGDQVWVSSGIYTQLVTLKANVALYGGFNGTETALAQRNWKTNLSWIT